MKRITAKIAVSGSPRLGMGFRLARKIFGFALAVVRFPILRYLTTRPAAPSSLHFEIPVLAGDNTAITV